MAKTGDIQKLRELTGAGVMASKKALDDAVGDFDKAVALIKERGFAKAAEKAGRETKAGLVKAYVHNDRVGALLELNCETDFVAHSDPFRELAHNLAMQIVAMNPKDVKELLAQPYIRDEGMTINDLVKGVILKTGENIKVGRFTRYEL
ncbi:MAG: translation elongation factor Ts [Candidatus Colwellbacteria bacterium]|nr:translation elongation factor Ts [Candidatus Colwellbacteria bacterium]